MMPSASGSLDSGSIDVEAVDSIDGPRLRPTASAGDGSNADGRRDADRRVDALRAERDLLAERVRRLTDEVAALEAEVEALEAAVESKERQRQQVIDNYESIVREGSAPFEAPGEDRCAEADADATAGASGGPLRAVAARLAGLVRRADE